MSHCQSCADLQRECDGLRLLLAEERERRMSLESQRARLVDLLNTVAERYQGLETRLDQIIRMMGKAS